MHFLAGRGRAAPGRRPDPVIVNPKTLENTRKNNISDCTANGVLPAPARRRRVPAGEPHAKPLETLGKTNVSQWAQPTFPAARGARGAAPGFRSPLTQKPVKHKGNSIFDCAANHIPLCIQVIVARCCLVQAKVRPPVAWIPVEILGNSCISCGRPSIRERPGPLPGIRVGLLGGTEVLRDLLYDQSPA